MMKENDRLNLANYECISFIRRLAEPEVGLQKQN